MISQTTLQLPSFWGKVLMYLIRLDSYTFLLTLNERRMKEMKNVQ